jgi:hypothetical protein
MIEQERDVRIQELNAKLVQINELTKSSYDGALFDVPVDMKCNVIAVMAKRDKSRPGLGNVQQVYTYWTDTGGHGSCCIRLMERDPAGQHYASQINELLFGTKYVHTEAATLVDLSAPVFAPPAVLPVTA